MEGHLCWKADAAAVAAGAAGAAACNCYLWNGVDGMTNVESVLLEAARESGSFGHPTEPKGSGF